ncbi:MAG: 2-phospho-L-lactate transferase [Acidobacteria bacterium]|nr:2-phospho-L-lactate transferase [Acidobacteriota bacterium]
MRDTDQQTPKDKGQRTTGNGQKITALAGGVGAAKFLLGLTRVMPPENLTIIANTGDDVEHFGLRISPDIDTVTYTLAGVINEATGWGLADDSFECLQWLARYDEATWFNLGDKDFATHIYRTNALKQGKTLSDVTRHISASLGVRSTILPMSDAYTPTRVQTDEGELHFQEYFVRRRCEPQVLEIRFDNIATAKPAHGVLAAIGDADAVVICPSNPFISISPILAVPGIRKALQQTAAQVIAITPIIAGQALKGPAADMLRDLGHEVSARGVAAMYQDFVNLFVLDEADAALQSSIAAFGMQVAVMNTLMKTLADKEQLARRVLALMA